MTHEAHSEGFRAFTPSRPAGNRLMAGAVMAAVAGAVVAGLLLVGSPKEARLQRLDDRTRSDLQAIADAAHGYWRRHARLPASLDELIREPGRWIAMSEPETAAAYEYRAIGLSTYELCATFHRESPPRGLGRERWAHGRGRQCFQLDVEERTPAPRPVSGLPALRTPPHATSSAVSPADRRCGGRPQGRQRPRS